MKPSSPASDFDGSNSSRIGDRLDTTNYSEGAALPVFGEAIRAALESGWGLIPETSENLG
jgi:hypothetical protein